MKIINTGGTFNKIYDPIKGELTVPSDDRAVEAAIESIRPGCEMVLEGIIYKDSLDMDDSDRGLLGEAVCGSREDMVVVVHGTDTIDKSAKSVDSRLGKFHKKRVVFTGAMVPFFIDPVEATANLASAVTAVRYLEPGVYVAMHGLVLQYGKIVKNRERGLFERAE